MQASLKKHKMCKHFYLYVSLGWTINIYTQEVIIRDNFCIVVFSGVHELTALYNTLQHFLSENKIFEGSNVHESNTYIYNN